jgi:RND family efflux transporter MFP subunit
MKSTTFIAIALGGSISLMALLAGCQTKAEPKTPVPVKLATVETNSAGMGSRYSATIIPRTEVELSFKVGGYVDELQRQRGIDGKMRDIQEGDRISAGAVLARVRQSDYQVKVTEAVSQATETKKGIDVSRAQYEEALHDIATNKSKLAEAEASQARAKLDYDRAQALFDLQSMTKANYDAAKEKYDTTTAQVAVARAQIQMKEATAESAKANISVFEAKSKVAEATVQETQIPLGDTALRSPLNGLVLQKSIERGTLVSNGTKAFTVADTSAVKAVFGVADVDVPEMKLGRVLSVESESMPGKEFRGLITSVFPAADPKSRAFNIEVTIQNPDFLLRPNMIVSLTVGAQPKLSAEAVIPLNAVMKAKNDPNGYAVFVVVERGGGQVAQLRDVKLGESYGNTIAVTAGVKPGDRVITTGGTMVNDGDQVKVIP